MKKSNKQQAILAVLTLVLTLGLVGCGKGLVINTDQNINVNQNQNVNVNQNANLNTNTSTTTTGEIDTSDWKTYRNEEYRFEFKYPFKYEQDDSIYHLWTGTQGAYNLLFNWGVNKYQETIFSIRVYNKRDLDSLLEIYHYEIGDVQREFGKGIIAFQLFTRHGNRQILAHEMLLIDNEYIYFVSSSFININGDFEIKDEFYGILNSLVIG